MTYTTSHPGLKIPIVSYYFDMTFIEKQTMHNSRLSDEGVKAMRDYDAWSLLCSLAMAYM